MKLKLITFKTNHTILGEVTEEKTFLKIKHPVQVIVQPTKDGPMMAFAPFLEFSEEFKTGVVLHYEDILCTSHPITELQNQYNQLFGSGIQIASAIPKI